MSLGQTPSSSRRVTWLVVTIGIALVLIARVLVSLFANNRLVRDALGANVLDVLVVSLGITGLIVVTALRGGYAAARKAVRRINADYPDALVFMSYLNEAETTALREVGVISPGYHPPQGVAVVLEPHRFAFWVGRQLVHLAEVRSEDLRYRAGKAAHGLSRPDAIIAEVISGGRMVRVPIVLLRDGLLIPKPLTADELAGVIRQLEVARR